MCYPHRALRFKISVSDGMYDTPVRQTMHITELNDNRFHELAKYLDAESLMNFGTIFKVRS